MADPVIAPTEEEWQNLSTLEAEISAWEMSNAKRLPAPYRSFLLTYNGGSPYPNVFDVAMPTDAWGSTDKQTFINSLYPFAFAVSMYSGMTFGEGAPRHFFFIGSNPGGLELLISLRNEDAGAVYCWSGTDVPWGTGSNTDTALHFQAKSFPDFIASLYDTEDKMGYDYWENPVHELLARPLIVG